MFGLILFKAAFAGVIVLSSKTSSNTSKELVMLALQNEPDPLQTQRNNLIE